MKKLKLLDAADHRSGHYTKEKGDHIKRFTRQSSLLCPHGYLLKDREMATGLDGHSGQRLRLDKNSTSPHDQIKSGVVVHLLKPVSNYIPSRTSDPDRYDDGVQYLKSIDKTALILLVLMLRRVSSLISLLTQLTLRSCPDIAPTTVRTTTPPRRSTASPRFRKCSTQANLSRTGFQSCGGRAKSLITTPLVARTATASAK